MGKTLQMLWGSWPRIWTNYNDFVETYLCVRASWLPIQTARMMMMNAKRVLLPEGIENTKNK